MILVGRGKRVAIADHIAGGYNLQIGVVVLYGVSESQVREEYGRTMSIGMIEIGMIRIMAVSSWC
jgi:hypothetical protein